MPESFSLFVRSALYSNLSLSSFNGRRDVGFGVGLG